MIKRNRIVLALLRFAYSKMDFIVISTIFVLTNIPSAIWEVYLVGVSWSDEWKVRSISIIVDVIFALPYTLLRKFLFKSFSFRSNLVRLYVSDTVAIFIVYAGLKTLKFFLFSQIGWISLEGLNIAIWSIFIFAIFFGRITGLIIDRSHIFFQREIKNFLEKRIGYALLRFGAEHFLFIQI